MTWLQAVDFEIFYWINSNLGNPIFDFCLPYFRDKWFWAPFYLFIVVLIWMNFHKEKSFILLLGLVFAVGISDFTSSQLIKKSVQRLRPCNDPQLTDVVHLRVGCGSGYSFTSSHAANHFAVATFLYIVLSNLFTLGIRRVFLFWAGLIAFSQVYVGVHYPGDVLAGGMLGMVFGIGIGKTCLWIWAIK